MPITRAKKEEFVGVLTDRFSRAQSAVFIDYRGLTVKNLQEIRRTLNAEGCDFHVAKNTLIKIALDANERTLVDNDGVSHDDLLFGLTAVAYGYENPAEPAKILLKLADQFPQIQFKGGFFGTVPVAGKAGVEKISRMRSKEDALARIVQMLRAAPYRVRLVAGAAPQKIITLKRLLEEEAA